MFLKSLELFGFKSFADRARIEFTEGISALLGPNGCGKSNVVDAIKWVLGEQSTRTLRAERMEDVIFNGTEARKALNVADVTLTLSDDGDALEMGLSEIAIRRRLFRSGDSEYYVNGTAAKLRDIREIFFDTGIGKSAYSIMEQGKIDQILSSKPEERRYMFEEAAGITKYKIRGAEAERKLERTEENMRQVENILREVKRSYDTLEVQAKQTEQYRAVRDDIFEVELIIQLLRLRGFLEQEEKKQDALEEKTKRRDTVKAHIDELNSNVETDLDTVNTMEAQLIDAQKRLYGLDLERGNCDSQILMQRERLEDLKRQIARQEDRRAELAGGLESIETQQAERRKALEDVDKRLEETEENIASFELNIANADARIGQIGDEIAAKERERGTLELNIEGLQDDLRNLYDDIVTQLDAKLQDTGYSLARKQEAESTLETALRALEIHLAGRVEIINDAIKVTGGAKDGRDRANATSAEALEDAVGRVREILKLFNSYKKAVPDFIDEFLAPEGIITRKREIDASIAEMRGAIDGIKRDADALREENDRLTRRVEEFKKTLEELRLNRVQMRTQRVSIRDTLSMLDRQREDVLRRLEENRREIAAAQDRAKLIDTEVARIDGRKKQLEKDSRTLGKELAKLEKGISERNQDLVSREKKLGNLRNELEQVQRQAEVLQVGLSETRIEIRNLYENFSERFSRDLRDYQSRMLEIQEPIAVCRERLSKLKDKLRDLGQVNLMAPEEFLEVKERYDFLRKQMDDLLKARQDLRVVTDQIREESTELFTETYEKVKRNFHSMFRRLFGGGRAELSLSDPENVLDSGVEIYAQPPGKKLESIDLLSGGERSLTAVGLLFATYMVKPSPFCVLDEIDAALDEENVGRFVSLLREFSESSQFVIITHNKRTVANAESLLGVTMEESGVSKVISVRLGTREEVPA